jgi:hypothetical protein
MHCLNSISPFCFFLLIYKRMSEQLTSVVERMARANANLERMATAGEQVKDIATLWREAYPQKNNRQQRDRTSLSAPGLG